LRALDRREDTPGFVQTVHKTAYAAIDPTRPGLSAAGKTVVVTGGATGIGCGIARHFAAAGASTIVLVARRANTLEEAAKAISKSYPNTEVLTYAVDISNNESVGNMFASAVNAAQTHAVDILVTSAAYVNPPGTVVELDPSFIETCFSTNLMGNLNLVRHFLRVPSSHKKTVLDVSSSSMHHIPPALSAYGASKGAFTYSKWTCNLTVERLDEPVVIKNLKAPWEFCWLYSTMIVMRHLQAENPDIRVHSFHPGTVLTPASMTFGITKEMFAPIEDDVSLPGGFAVWLASPEAEFTKGRYLLSKWDVEDLIKNKHIFEKDPTFSTVELRLWRL
jgi:NAD(P)-dependent dehydrogenase (short-subunit alcohol dehydrogenase family)